MSLVKLIVHLEIEQRLISCHEGNSIAIVTVIGETDGDEGENSYVASLINKGINKIAQKVGEEAVEVVIEAKDNNNELFLNEH